VFVWAVGLLLLDTQPVKLVKDLEEKGGGLTNLVRGHIPDRSALYALHNQQATQPEIKAGGHAGGPELTQETGLFAGVGSETGVKEFEGQGAGEENTGVLTVGHGFQKGPQLKPFVDGRRELS